MQLDLFNHMFGIGLDHAELVRNYRYDRRTGLFYRRGENIPLGQFNSDGYVKITIRGKHFNAHRLAWFYAHGKWPIFIIDHINRKRYDNRIINLRDVPQKVNAVKRPANADKIGPFRSFGRKHWEWVLHECCRIATGKSILCAS